MVIELSDTASLSSLCSYCFRTLFLCSKQEASGFSSLPDVSFWEWVFNTDRGNLVIKESRQTSTGSDGPLIRTIERHKSLLGVGTVCPGTGVGLCRAEEGTLGQECLITDTFFNISELNNASGCSCYCVGFPEGRCA